jgi:hypothetical protein
VHFERPQRVSGSAPHGVSDPALVVPRGGRALIAWYRYADVNYNDGTVEFARLLPPGE